jgi:hypothetical protein
MFSGGAEHFLILFRAQELQVGLEGWVVVGGFQSSRARPMKLILSVDMGHDK